MLLAALLAFGLAPRASADVLVQPFVPESGFYFDPAAPGRGYAIEIQDRTLFMTAYVYSEEPDPRERTPIWFSAEGLIVEGRAAGIPIYDYVGGQSGPFLNFSEQGQCLGCPYVAPVTESTGRRLSIEFLNPTQATMTIDGERIDLRRFWFSESITDPIFALFGQWMIVTDYTAVDDTILPFEGDLLELAFEGSANGSPTAEGFRGGTTIPVAAAWGEVDDFFVFVVEERPGVENLAYYFPGSQFGTQHFFGRAERYVPGTNPTFVGFPMQGYRISDRTHTENVITTKGAWPAAEEMADAGPIRPARAPRPTGSDVAGAPKLADEQRARLTDLVRRLEAQLASAREP